MKIFSDELGVQAIIKNTQLGFRVLIDEWYWLLLQPCHNYKVKQLEKELNTNIDEESKISLSQKIDDIKQAHLNFREMQIQARIKAYL